MGGVANPAEEYFKDGIWGWDGTVWRKLPLVWGYSDLLYESYENLNAPAVFAFLTAASVPAGEIWIITHILAYDTDNAITRINLVAHDGVTAHAIRAKQTIAVYEEVMFTGRLVLKKDWYIQAHYWGCTAGDDIYLHIHGYKMKVAE